MIHYSATARLQTEGPEEEAHSKEMAKLRTLSIHFEFFDAVLPIYIKRLPTLCKIHKSEDSWQDEKNALK